MADVQHLALIQGVISRMANSSFLIKGWTVTLVAGLSALAADKGEVIFAWLALGVGIVFALLDAFYLALERAYAQLYRRVADDDQDQDPWTLDCGRVGPAEVVTALTGFAIWPLYGAALVGVLVVALVA